MRGISEERLHQIIDSFLVNDMLFDDLRSLLISECKEVNPWLPIENAPKDTRLLLFYGNDGDVITTGVKIKIRTRRSYVFVPDGSHHFPLADMPTCDRTPTHYQELPDDPV